MACYFDPEICVSFTASFISINTASVATFISSSLSFGSDEIEVSGFWLLLEAGSFILSDDCALESNGAVTSVELDPPSENDRISLNQGCMHWYLDL